MKRFSTILFTAIYLIASSGILVGQHLCMGRVKETALFKKVEKNCGMSLEMHQEMEGCCQDELILKKLEDDQQLTTVKIAPDTKYFLLYEASFNELITTSFSSIHEVEVQNTGPPDIEAPNLFILYHSLKIPSALQS
ncbi:HYC_CC_PP family protein [Roseivirga sp.]|uniref:HYC_CC_PP family protein n=1 Tax=Roseivirga sp. TaxID=1964215 RepID=UPI003B8CD809